uniref:Uncharacterized protein n=1 Tax=Tetraodon nigroviridis TaxID=99883 RepID=H3CM00_TETNG
MRAVLHGIQLRRLFLLRADHQNLGPGLRPAPGPVGADRRGGRRAAVDELVALRLGHGLRRGGGPDAGLPPGLRRPLHSSRGSGCVPAFRRSVLADVLLHYGGRAPLLRALAQRGEHPHVWRGGGVRRGPGRQRLRLHQPLLHHAQHPQALPQHQLQHGLHRRALPDHRLRHDHRLGGAGRRRRRPAAPPRAPAPLLPAQPVPDVATGAGTPPDQRAGPEPPLPLAAQPPPGPAAAADPTERTGGRTHTSAAVAQQCCCTFCTGHQAFYDFKSRSAAPRNLLPGCTGSTRPLFRLYGDSTGQWDVF